MEKEGRIYFANRKFGGRLAIILCLCLERVKRSYEVKRQRDKGRKPG